MFPTTWVFFILTLDVLGQVIIDNIDSLITILINELDENETKINVTTFGQECKVMGPKALNIFRLFEKFLTLGDEKVNCAIALSNFFPVAMVNFLYKDFQGIFRTFPLEQHLPLYLL